LRFGTYDFVSDYGCPHPGMPLCRKQSRRSRDAPIVEAGTNIALGRSKNCLQYTPLRRPSGEGSFMQGILSSFS
jgi:hypothetical protein